MVAALVRSSTRASRPPVPAASTNPVCHRSQASTRRFLCGSRAQIGLPRRVSSIPSTATGCSGAAVGGPDVGRERGVHDGPVHAVVGSGFRDNPALFGDRVPELGPWPRRQPRAGPHCRQRLAERVPGAKPFLAAPSPLMSDQPQHSCSVRDTTQPRTDPTLEAGGQHPTVGTRRRGLVGGDYVHHSAAEGTRLDAVDREATQV